MRGGDGTTHRFQNKNLAKKNQKTGKKAGIATHKRICGSDDVGRGGGRGEVEYLP